MIKPAASPPALCASCVGTDEVDQCLADFFLGFDSSLSCLWESAMSGDSVHFVHFARVREQLLRVDRMPEVPLFELVPQPLRDRNFGVRRELGRRFGAGGRIGQFDLEHGKRYHAYRMPYE